MAYTPIDVAGAVSDYQDSTDSNAAAIGSLRSQQAQYGNAAVAATEQEGTDKALAEQVKLAGLLNAQTKTINDANAIQPEDTIAALSKVKWDAYNQTQALNDQIIQKRASSVYDDPFQAISDLFTVGHDIKLHNAIAEKGNAAEAMLNQSAQDVQQQAAANKATAEIMTTESNAAQADAIKQASITAANLARAQNLNYNVDALQTLQQATDKNLNSTIQAHAAANSDENTAISQQHLDLARQEAARHAAEFRERMDLKEQGATDLQDYADKINAGRALQGLPSMTPNEIRRVIANDPNGKVNFTQFYQAGSVKLATGISQIDSSPTKSAILLANNRGTLPPTASDVQAYLNAGVAEGVSKLGVVAKTNPAAGKMTMDNLQTQMGDSLQAGAKIMLNDRTAVIPGTKTNLYAAPNLDTIAQLAPAVAATPLYQVALAPLVAAGQKTSDPAQVIAVGKLAVQNGTLSMNDFVDGVTKLYGSANVVLDSTKQYRTVGLPAANGDGTGIPSYPVKLSNSSLNPFNQTDKVDLANKTSTASYINKLMVNEVLRQRGVDALGGNSGMPIFNPQ